MINAGALNQRLTILQRSATVDAAGQPLDTWTELATVWADVRTPSGMQGATAAISSREGAMAAYSARIRYRADVTTAMRASVGAQLFDIVNVLYDFAGQEYVDLVLVAGGVA